MNRLKTLLVAALVAAPVLAKAGEEIYLFRTEENAEQEAYAEEVCAEFGPNSPGKSVILGAYTYAPRTRARDALVMNDLGVRVGSAIGCGKLQSATQLYPFTASIPFRILFEVKGVTVRGIGYCTGTTQVPGQPVFLMGCYLDVQPDEANGILAGSATSSSVFVAGAAPQYQTGSFWTVHLYTAN